MIVDNDCEQSGFYVSLLLSKAALRQPDALHHDRHRRIILLFRLSSILR